MLAVGFCIGGDEQSVRGVGQYSNECVIWTDADDSVSSGVNSGSSVILSELSTASSLGFRNGGRTSGDSHAIMKLFASATDIAPSWRTPLYRYTWLGPETEGNNMKDEVSLSVT